MKNNTLTKKINEFAGFHEVERIRYATERFLSRVELGSFKNNLILKGGFLLGVIFKNDGRTTKDLDTLLNDISADKHSISNLIQNIIQIDLGDGIYFKLISLVETQNAQTYSGFRAKLILFFHEERSTINFYVDFGVGDIITPSIVERIIPLKYPEKDSVTSLSLNAYPIETIVAEKFEIILKLGTWNSRMKDFYDLYLILNYEVLPQNMDLYKAIENTWNTRHKDNPVNQEVLEDWLFTIYEISIDQNMSQTSWPNFIKTRSFIQNLEFSQITELLSKFLEEFRFL